MEAQSKEKAQETLSAGQGVRASISDAYNQAKGYINPVVALIKEPSPPPPPATREQPDNEPEVLDIVELPSELQVSIQRLLQNQSLDLQLSPKHFKGYENETYTYTHLMVKVPGIGKELDAFGQIALPYIRRAKCDFLSTALLNMLLTRTGALGLVVFIDVPDNQHHSGFTEWREDCSKLYVRLVRPPCMVTKADQDSLINATDDQAKGKMLRDWLGLDEKGVLRGQWTVDDLLENEKTHSDTLHQIQERLQGTAQNSVSPKEFLEKLIRATGWPQPQQNSRINALGNDPELDVHRLIAWAIEMGSIPGSSGHTFLGSLLEQLLQYLGDEGQEFLRQVIRDYKLFETEGH